MYKVLLNVPSQISMTNSYALSILYTQNHHHNSFPESITSFKPKSVEGSVFLLYSLIGPTSRCGSSSTFCPLCLVNLVIERRGHEQLPLLGRPS